MAPSRSKIRDPETGRLLPLPPAAGRSGQWSHPDPSGERMRSTQYFRVAAQVYVAPARAGDRNARTMLKLIRAECALFLEARRQGVPLRDGIKLERDPSPTAEATASTAARRDARAAGHGRYEGAPCPSCRGTLRYTTDARCAACKPGYFDK